MEIKPALIRLGRILIAQAIPWLILELNGINIPVLNISLGAAISAAAKYLRDKYKWTWLPL